MASLQLNISNPSDTREEQQAVDAVQHLVNGNTTPQSAAQVIDKIIITDCTGSNASNILGWLHYLWDCIGKAAMVVPAEHSGQDKLVRFMRELQKLPRHSIAYSVNGQAFDKELWTLTKANRYEGFEQWMWDLREGHFVGHVAISETAAISYQNFSAFLARLLASGLVEATRLSALVQPSPFAVKLPSESNKQSYDPHMRAAGQWILHAGNVLYEMCEKNTVIEIGRPKWSPKVWRNWRAKFEAVEQAEYFSSDCRDVARRVASGMDEIGKQGVTTNVVEVFGFMSAQDNDEEEEEYLR